ncbi:MAG: hypothetical protein RL375_3873 [Pseudomonadota bacterium]
MKTVLIITAAMALTSPLAFAEDRQPVTAKADAAKAHHKQSTSDRQVAKQLMATGTGTAALGAAAKKPETRDWAAIDSNGDNLISADEMQKYLEASWAAQKST